MRSLLDIEYSLKTMEVLLDIQTKEGYKMDLYIEKNPKPYSFWDIDNFKADLEYIDVNNKLGQSLTSLLNQIENLIERWVDKFEDLPPPARDLTNHYNTSFLFFRLNKSKYEPITPNKIFKKDSHHVYEGQFETIKMVSKEGSLYNQLIGIKWDETGIILTDEYLDLIYNPRDYVVYPFEDSIRKCDELAAYLKEKLPKEVLAIPFNHNYTPIQIQVIAEELKRLKRINNTQEFCDIMNGQKAGKIHWTYKKKTGVKSDLKTFICYFLKREEKELNKKATLDEINRVFAIGNENDNSDIKKDGHFTILKPNDFEHILDEIK